MDEELIPSYERHRNFKDKSFSNQPKVKVLAWEHYKENKEGVIPSLESIKNMVINASKQGYKLSTVCLPIVLFLTGCRVHELLPTYSEWFNSEKNKHTWERTPKTKLHPGIRIKDLTITWKNNNDEKQTISAEFLKIRTRTEKLGKKDWKTAIVKIDATNYYYLMIQLLDSYIQELTQKLLSDFNDDNYKKFGEIELFPFCVSVARKKVKLVFGKYISVHLIRVWRAKQLVRDHNFTPQKLKKFIGWSSSEMPMHYTEATEKELEKTLDDTDVYDFNKIDEEQ